MRATKHFQYGLLDPQRKEKKIKLFTRESSQQERRRTRNLFWFFLRFIKHTKRKIEKENQTSMNNTMKEYEHRQLE